MQIYELGSNISFYQEDFFPKAKAPKPSFYKRIFYGTVLIIAQFATFIFQIIHSLFPSSLESKKRLKGLFLVSQKGDFETIQNYLKKHANLQEPLGYLFSEFLLLSELYPHFPEILKGANVRLKDQGYFCKRWQKHAHCIKRLSSHKHLGKYGYEIDHLLFWIDLNGNTSFQFERSPMFSFFSRIEHFLDYLRYKRDHEQQGVIGSSPYTEDYHLSFALRLEFSS